MRYSLHWLCWQPTPYNDFLFRSLAPDPEINLTVHFRDKVVPSHPWRLAEMAQGFKWRTYERVWGLDWHLLRLAVNDNQSFFVIGGWEDPTIVALINVLCVYRRPFAIWSDTPSPRANRGSLKTYLRSAWLKRVFASATHVMGTGMPALSALRQMGCPQHKLVNFPFFVDLDVYRRGKHDCERSDASNTLKFVSSGRLINAVKGHDVAISAFAKARSLTGLDNFEYWIAGTGPDLDTLRRQIEEVGLEARVKFLGWLNPTEIHDLYLTTDILIQPSRIDPFPVAVLEAMAAGMVVLGSDSCGSVRDRIRHGENGFAHSTGDVDELAAQIGHLLAHPEIVTDIGLKARQTAEDWPVSRGVQIVKSVLIDAKSPCNVTDVKERT